MEQKFKRFLAVCSVENCERRFKGNKDEGIIAVVGAATPIEIIAAAE